MRVILFFFYERGVYIPMLKFTYITAVIIGLSIICVLLPKKVYKRSQVNFRLLGIWILILTVSIQGLTWVFYGIITWIKCLLILYGITWGFTI